MDDNPSSGFDSRVATIIAALNELHLLLEQERGALLGRNPSTLEAAISRKLPALVQVETAAGELDDWLSGTGCAAGIKGGDQWLEANAHSAELAARWRSLKELSRRVAALNNSNGHLVHQARIANRAALEAVTGRTEAPGPYDKNGQGGTTLPTYKLGEA